ncbi:MAG: hypothetical protein AAB596_02225 [Patescibacteria group bacterium]
MKSNLLKFKENLSQIISNNSGQAMLLAVFLIGSGILAFTSIAGYLMAQRIRTASDITDSAKAIIAADAGLECGLYKIYKSDSNLSDCANWLIFNNGASNNISTFTITGNNYLKVIGSSRRSNRAFIIGL